MAKKADPLTAEELETWRVLELSGRLLEDAVDRRLQHDHAMPLAYHRILAALAAAPTRALRMSDLAAELRYSPSRLTHAVACLEGSGWVVRRRCATDGRGQIATLTESGEAVLAEARLSYAAEVRKRVFARLTPKQAGRLRGLCETLLGGLEADSPSTV